MISNGDIQLEAAGDIGGGGTGKEFVSNLLNDGTESWNKWVHPGEVSSSWVEASLSKPYRIRGSRVLNFRPAKVVNL